MLQVTYRFHLSDTSISVSDNLRTKGVAIQECDLLNLIKVRSVVLSAKIRHNAPHEVHMSIIVIDKNSNKYYRNFKINADDNIAIPYNITAKNRFVAAALKLDSDLNKQLRALAHIIVAVKRNEHAQPVNGDMIAVRPLEQYNSYYNKYNLGLFYENLFFPYATYLDKGHQLSSSSSRYMVIPRYIVDWYFEFVRDIIKDNMKKISLFYDYNLVHKMNEVLVNEHKPHEPGHAYIPCDNIYTLEIYFGYGALFNPQTMTTKNGHIYVNVPLGKWTDELLAYNRPNININKLRQIIYKTLYDKDGNIRLPVLTARAFKVLKNRRKSYRYDYGHLIDKEGDFTIANSKNEVCGIFIPKAS